MKTKITFLLFFTVYYAWASERPGIVGFQFLRTNVGARPAAMAGSFLAIPGDIHSLYFNPAGISRIEKRTAGFTYQDDLLDFNSGFVGFVQPQVGPGNIGVGILYKDYGNFSKRDTKGADLGQFSANSISMAVGYGIEAKKNLLLGASVKYIRFSIDNYFADAAALDAGVMYIFPQYHLALAAGLLNLGTAMSAFVETKDELPLNYRVGLSKKLEHLPLLINLTIYQYQHEALNGAIGGEFTLSKNLFLRLGYDSMGRDLIVESSDDKFAGAAIGFGILWKDFCFDYAFTTYGELGSLSRFSIIGQF
ncbi:PorV/PorQ family protein [candidate division KSB1 bacterium]|nr:PorV/PorQ family protein [candidate division KSB1 bacterium]